MSHVTLVFGGDFCPIRGYEKKMLQGKEIFASEILSLFRNHISVINLEAPLCDATLPTASFAGYGLRGSPEVIPYLKKLEVDAWGLANNHVLDFKEEGVRQTMRYLDDAGIRCFGAGENSETAERPMAIQAGGLKIGVWAIAEKELNLATTTHPGAAEFCPFQNPDKIRKMREAFDFLVVFVHAGHEFTTVPSPRIRSAYRAFIDAGADAVIGHHPHVIQGVERWGNGFIAYSLGNLVFDSPYVSAYEETDIGFLLKLEISRHKVHNTEIFPYRLEKDFFVSLLQGEDKKNFKKKFNDLSDVLADEKAFQSEWEKNVRFRWETAYRSILNDFSHRFMTTPDLDVPRRARNLFTCPTHVEMIEKICYMLEDPTGGLSVS